jgi:hypothetical protein
VWDVIAWVFQLRKLFLAWFLQYIKEPILIMILNTVGVSTLKLPTAYKESPLYFDTVL